ncbi:MAG: cobalamin-dependent protein [Anaerolineae bacterium]|jgi:methanogenic corrinoid protein MtbC1|nr:cobalamin-dependent protein [Anaerolineae bacterium]
MNNPDTQWGEMQAQLRAAIDGLDEDAAVALAQAALAQGVTPLEFFRNVVEPVLTAIGDAFSRLEVFLPDLMRAGVVVKAVQTKALEPAIRASGGVSSSEGRVVIGTAQGDIHDIGKNMVALMLQVNGFTVTDLGTNVSTAAFIDVARRENADIIAMSSLLTTSLPFVKDVLARLDAAGERARFMVIAGGAPVTEAWSQAAGLNGFAEDAVEAVALCRGLMAKRREAAA